VLAASVIRAMMEALIMEAANTSETSVNFYETAWHNNPEDSHLHPRRRENLKSYISKVHLSYPVGFKLGDSWTRIE
jgi:hypothetical protein